MIGASVEVDLVDTSWVLRWLDRKTKTFTDSSANANGIGVWFNVPVGDAMVTVRGPDGAVIGQQGVPIREGGISSYLAEPMPWP